MNNQPHPTIVPENYDDRTLEEKLNGDRGEDYWEPNEYNREPEYGEVDTQVFSSLFSGDWELELEE